MANTERDLKRERLYVRVSPRQRAIIAEAAEAGQRDLSSFVLDAAITDAQRILADRRVFALGDSDWDRFVEILDRPVSDPASKARLKKLLKDPSILEV